MASNLEMTELEDCIDRLNDDVIRYRDALTAIRDVQFPGWEAQTAVDYCRDIAARALVRNK